MSAISHEKDSQRYKVKFHGDGGNYFGIWLVNGLLSIITLGIYSAWAKVRNYRYFYGNTELAGDRFDYHARPMQILLGRLLVVLGIVLFYICIFASEALGLFLAAVFAALLPWIIVRNWRFNAIMTSYRGVRFNYHVHTGRAYMAFLIWPVLVYLALFALVGLCFTMMNTMGQTLLAGIAAILIIPGFIAVNGIVSAIRFDLYVNNMFFGDSAFKGEMKKAAFVKFALVSSIIAVPFIVLIGMALGSFIYNLFLISQLGGDEDAVDSMVLNHFDGILMTYVLVLLWGMVARAYLAVAHRNYMFNQTTLEDGKIRFYSTMKVMPYIWLLLVNGLIILFSCGLATPFAHVRHARYMAQTLEVEGDLDALTIHAHSDTARSAVAEELVQALDINIGV